jgi:hypothetical protein
MLMGDNSNFLNYKRKIFTATPLSTKPNTFILFHLIDKRACNYLKCDPSYLCGRVAQRNIDVLSAEKGERCRTTCRTNGLDGLPREYVHTRMNVHGGGDVGVKEDIMGNIHFTLQSTANPPFKKPN